MTRIFDDPANFADEALDGFVAANRDRVIRVDGGVLRATETPAGQVALVIGGGSGHYPAFAGLVGVGLASGAACGNMFASPAAGQVYRVACAADTGGGVLLCYGNYAGDVLNFDLAEQRLNADGIRASTVLATDDIASAPVEESGKRRGIAGDLIVFKIAGAAAEAGLNLDEVEALARKANERTRSLGVAFAGCTLPGADAPLFTVPAGHMSLGLGIHGEPGISDRAMPGATELAELLVSSLLAERPADAGSRVVPIVNGLGTVKYEELFLLYGTVEKLLVAAGLEIVQPECGELVTSLDMSGLSLTLFWPDDELERYWAAPADAPAYRKGTSAPRALRHADEVQAATLGEHEAATAASARLGEAGARALEVVRSVVVQHEAALGDLDAIAGDGDHGIGMRRGADAAADAARADADAGDGIRAVLSSAGEAWSEKAGGTSGALWGAALIAVGASLGNREDYGAKDASAAAIAFCDAVTGLGKAELGDKTMVDALLPFTDAFTQSVDAGRSQQAALASAATTATDAAEKTAPMSPKKGRARPLSERSIGHPDPGAASFALIMSGLAESFESIRTGEQ